MVILSWSLKSLGTMANIGLVRKVLKESKIE